MTKYEKTKQAMLKLAISKKIKKLGYKLIGYDYILRQNIIDIICLDKTSNNIIFIMVITRKSPKLGSIVDYMNKIDELEVITGMNWFQRSHNFENYISRLDIIEGYVGTKTIKLKYHKNVLSNYNKDNANVI